MKKCSKCLIEKKESEFYSYSRRVCKQCYQEYRKTKYQSDKELGRIKKISKEKQQEYWRNYYSKNAEREKERNKTNYLSNREYCLKRQSAYDKKRYQERKNESIR